MSSWGKQHIQKNDTRLFVTTRNPSDPTSCCLASRIYHNISNLAQPFSLRHNQTEADDKHPKPCISPNPSSRTPQDPAGLTWGLRASLLVPLSGRFQTGGALRDKNSEVRESVVGSD